MPGETICGACHIGQEKDWQATAHADAWNGLQQSGAVRESCEACHTVSSLGNAVTQEAVGWVAVEDDRYHDVQCESCHGPGQTHVENPGEVNDPLAPMQVGATLTTGCGECHSGTHHPFVEEWEQSPHGSVVAAAAGREECEGCHVGEGVLRQWGVTSDYLEKESLLQTAGQSMPITCGVCHDPHSDPWDDAQLRFPVTTSNFEQHLCGRCHDRRTSPDPQSSHGLEPHSPETALLEGTAGWFPPGSTIDEQEIRGTHGAAANTRLCATCHVNSFEVTDEDANFVFQATGHLFLAAPCLDASGIPTPDETCAVSASARSFQGCTASGCHGSQQVAAGLMNTAGLRIMNLAEQLHDLLVAVDPNLTAAGGEIDPTNPTFTVAEGAFFNLALSEHGGALQSAIHNPFLMETLLLESIREVRRVYPQVAGMVTVSLERELLGSR